MGQINSTNGNRRVSPASVSSAGLPTTVSEDRYGPGTGSSNSVDGISRKRAHRRSLRDSIVGALVPRPPDREGQENASRPDTESRKWWRSSRRWSKSPLAQLEPSSNIPVIESPYVAKEVGGPPLSAHDPGDSPDGGSNPESSLMGTALNEFQGRTSSTIPDAEPLIDGNYISPSRKGKEVTPLCSDATTLPSVDSTKDNEQSTSASHFAPPPPVDLGDTTEHGSASASGPPSETFLTNASTDMASESPLMLGEPGARPAQENRPARHFPPAGTLVVVQGVVHTSDAVGLANNNAVPTSPPDPGPPSGSLPALAQQQPLRVPAVSQRSSMLSNLLRRRGSAVSLGSHISSEPDVSGLSSPRGVRGTSRPTTQSAIAELNSPRRRSVEHVPHGLLSSVGDGNTQELPRGQGSLSSNSVDVLGALLSVATAATAASLLSSSNGRHAESNLSRAGAPSETRGSPAPIDSSSANSAPGLTIPALVRALANANPAAAAAIAQREHEREREEHERTRIRTLWDGLRERLVHGRGGREYTPTSQTTGIPHSDTSAGSIDRERRADGSVIPDSLFSELARAFNLAPSQDDRQAEAQDVSDVVPSTSANQAYSTDLEQDRSRREIDIAPPDSFERFLIDLQTDLRVALTRMESVSNSRSSRVYDPTRLVGSDEDAGGPSENREAVRTATGGEDSSGSDVVGTRNNQRRDSTVPDNRGGVSERALSPSMPDPVGTLPPTDESISVSERVEGTGLDARVAERSEVGGRANEELQHLPTDNSIPPSAPSPPSDGASAVWGDRNSTVNARGINWWRMYRFPAMRPPQSQQHGTMSNLAPSNTTTDVPSDTRPSSTSTSTTGGPSTSNASLEQDALVVPVIVVGLQSINPNNERFPPTQAPSPTSPLEEEDNEFTHGARDTDATSLNGSSESQRSPNWSSRAARAFSRLGRNGGPNITEREQDAQENFGGSRTFFIYVFGGYYPPDHHILTGANNLDSFEALWELAEMLGQVKPPVATDEEIERSGLQVFKAKTLEELEDSGRVASNCIDRCLICLDDYKPEDDLRLLSCKHAFHKACVDQWLKTGRNNCPACRSKGVKTGERNSPFAPAT